MQLTILRTLIIAALLIAAACDEKVSSSSSGEEPAVTKLTLATEGTSTKTGQSTSAPVAAAVKVVVVVPETQYPLKQLPLPTAGKSTIERSGSSDPTLSAFRARLDGGSSAGSTGLVPFQRFTLPNPLEGSQSLPLRSAIADVEMPVTATTGRPAIPVLK